MTGAVCEVLACVVNDVVGAHGSGARRVWRCWAHLLLRRQTPWSTEWCLARNQRFVAAMAAGAVTDFVTDGLLLGMASAQVLISLLVALLLVSAVKLWRHAH